MRFPFFRRAAAAAPQLPAPVQPPQPISNAENRRMIRARFDSQFTTDENRRQFELADVMSVDAAASMEVRRILRMRCRYEYHNNPFFMGAANRLSRFTIGTGPRLHMATGDKKLDEFVEDGFTSWAKQTRVARKLRTSRTARVYNGENFLLMGTNPVLRHPVKLDLFEREADQVASPLFGMYPAGYPDQFFDGVMLDPWGNPEVYHVLRQHPGAFGAFVLMGYEFDPWPARYVIHDYDHVRPGQQRGIPEAVPGLDLFGELRRYRKAVLAAAETAADHAGFIQSDGPADGDDTEMPEAGDYFEVKRRMMGVLPAGWKAAQMKAEQPTGVYDAYTLSLLRELSQVMDMPLFMFTGDASNANMSSAYVVSQSFVKAVQCDRSEYDLAMDRVFDEWIAEARQIPNYLPNDLPKELPHAWRWDRINNHADPLKSATAAKTRITTFSSIPREAAMEGYDWQEEQEAAAKSLGMTVPDYQALLRQSLFTVRGDPPPEAVAPEPDPDPLAPTPVDEGQGEDEDEEAD